MGAALANNGINPATGEHVIKAEDVPHILSRMTMAGPYDGSGGWAWHVGLPAKRESVAEFWQLSRER